MALLNLARRVITSEADALRKTAGLLDKQFENAVHAVANSSGTVVVTGVGKSGVAARKIAATLASLGTKAVFVHAAEAAHGDLGMIQQRDVVVAISHSGETKEILHILPRIRNIGAKIVSITGHPTNALASLSDIVLPTGVHHEAGPIASVPTSSTTAAQALGDALATCVAHVRGVTWEDYLLNHPGGAIGSKGRQNPVPVPTPTPSVTSIATGTDRASTASLDSTPAPTPPLARTDAERAPTPTQRPMVADGSREHDSDPASNGDGGRVDDSDPATNGGDGRAEGRLRLRPSIQPGRRTGKAGLRLRPNIPVAAGFMEARGRWIAPTWLGDFARSVVSARRTTPGPFCPGSVVRVWVRLRLRLRLRLEARGSRRTAAESVGALTELCGPLVATALLLSPGRVFRVRQPDAAPPAPAVDSPPTLTPTLTCPW
eukprot:CAMPEP_0196654028 /NCGR_PEP_ID=MMETSP1086-20130531/3707_1 /TAXON_ID=77921 /ORGANISM="Cyanoptyche  gloeocystis , Strain SAG4.97" /LENGTH=431 /DNA_ID=CAMNT_0041985549 /DNA_START=128 /DNA_END=1421 /DNA_ORIENTATION=+